MQPIRNVSVVPRANVYFDGLCISYTLEAADGSRQSVGVILPASLTFTTAAAERMEVVAGRCRVRLAGESDWQEYTGGERFSVPADSRFDIEVGETLHYVCHYG